MTEHADTFRIPKQKRVRLMTPRSVYTKLILLYTLCYTAAFALGCLLFHLTGEAQSTQFDRRIAGYFSAGFAGCADVFAFTRRLLSIGAQDLTQLCLVFMAGFTVFASLAVGGLLIFRGVSFGFSVSYLASVFRSGSASMTHPTVSLLVFSLLGALNAALMIHLSARTAMFSDEFKALCGRPRLILRSKALYAQLLRFLIATGAILFLTLLRCAL